MTEGTRERHSKNLPPIGDDPRRTLIDLERRSLDLLDLLIEHHGNDNETGVRADVPSKIAAQLKRRR